jgi:dihydrofolate reductase
MPWVNINDLAFFKKMTMGAVIIFGTRTLNLLPPLPGRILHPYTGRYATPKDTLLYVKEAYPGWPIWIGGGARTYRDFAPYVDGLKLLSVIDYDGEADTYFPFDAYGMSIPEKAET